MNHRKKRIFITSIILVSWASLLGTTTSFAATVKDFDTLNDHRIITNDGHIALTEDGTFADIVHNEIITYDEPVRNELSSTSSTVESSNQLEENVPKKTEEISTPLFETETTTSVDPSSNSTIESRSEIVSNSTEQTTSLTEMNDNTTAKNETVPSLPETKEEISHSDSDNTIQTESAKNESSIPYELRTETSATPSPVNTTKTASLAATANLPNTGENKSFTIRFPATFNV